MFFLPFVKDFTANIAASNSSAFIWRDHSSLFHMPWVVTPLHTDPHPFIDASDVIIRSGAGVIIALPFQSFR